MDEDKRRKRDTQLTGWASAKRVLACRAVRLGGARPYPPKGAAGNFFWPPPARKLLIIQQFVETN